MCSNSEPRSPKAVPIRLYSLRQYSICLYVVLGANYSTHSTYIAVVLPGWAGMPWQEQGGELEEACHMFTHTRYSRQLYSSHLATQGGMEDRGNNRTRGVYRTHRGGMEDRGSSKTRGVCRTVHTSKWGGLQPLHGVHSAHP